MFPSQLYLCAPGNRVFSAIDRPVKSYRVEEAVQVEVWVEAARVEAVQVEAWVEAARAEAVQVEVQVEAARVEAVRVEEAV
jgi:hypothetical protein